MGEKKDPLHKDICLILVAYTYVHLSIQTGVVQHFGQCNSFYLHDFLLSTLKYQGLFVEGIG